jgi:hypothetical protein
VDLLSACTIEATCWACNSNPTGNIILAVSPLICFHFKVGGFPPNCWPLAEDLLMNKRKNKTIRKQGIVSIVFAA